MAKKYLVKNITTDPARPIILMCCGCGGAIGVEGNSRMVSTDAEGVTLTEAEYKHCKEALDRYEAADMVVVKEVEGELTADEKAEQEKRDDENAKAKEADELVGLREDCKALGVKGYHLMGSAKLKAARDKAINED